ncbi:efflux RND transporter permease subunit [Bdellovibrio svalbardensis]|uniref:Efflux RND transporter permease subunit n=1 Tax=Bdellovibrio svalbardensis TaxID=2972972 RepID=A0ABT6DGK5_9BACT|nr:efflux RND transporter permease subunit [Bdellovibrio svalbardensis]MDG0815634.1 efflux RND transporter permease subunit [Bdellovibrio svalbardensis]
MSLPKISISRPIFMTCVTIAIVVVGWASFKSMSVDLYPDVSIPVVTVQTVYKGAGPAEIETLVSRPIEDEVSTISGIKRMTSKNMEGVSQVIVEFISSVDSKYAEQQVRDKVNIAKPKLPEEVEDSVIKKFDPSDTPIVMLSLTGDLSDAQLYDIADQVIKPRLEQVNNVGAIEILGGRKREVHVLLDRAKLKAREISVSQVAAQVGAMGENIPSGKVNQGGKELVFRGLGEFRNVQEISDTLVNLYGNEVPTRVADLGVVKDTVEDEKSRGFVDGKKSIFLQVYRQSGSNTVKVADDVFKQMAKIEPELAKMEGAPKIQLVTNASQKIRDNVADVNETIIIAIILTVITVFFFLGSARTTLITAFSLPVSLVGAFMLMKMAGFSINIVSMLALTLAVGLLVDDAIVVVENIYRRMELGEDSIVAAERGTTEIQMAVMAISLVVIAVFVPVGTMSGTIGQFLKQFGFTVVFSMIISWFVAMTIIPMLTAYFGGSGHGGAGHDKEAHKPESFYDKTLGRMVKGFDRFQSLLERIYEKFLRVTLRHPLMTIGATLLVFFLSIYTVTKVPGTFIADDDSGEVTVTLEMEPGTSLDGTNKVGEEVDKIIHSNSNVLYTTMTIGSIYGEANKASFYVRLKDGKERGMKTEIFRDKLRQQLAGFSYANPVVKKYDASGGMAAQPFMLNIISPDPKDLEKYGMQVYEALKKDPRLKDVDSNFRAGKPELQVHVKPGAAKAYGINTKTMGGELRAQVEGMTPAKFREKGREYDVRVRLNEDQRDLKKTFNQVYVPNINRKLVRLSDVANGDLTSGPASIERMDRGRYIQITAGLAPGVGLSDVVNDAVKMMSQGDTKFPSGVRYNFGGDAENMQELAGSTILALGFAVMFIYLILASLYESFITPITIMVALPLALCGAFFGLYLANEIMSLFAVFGFFMLIGVAGKNGILLVDFTNQMMAEGKSRADALVLAGKTRLRPILMTSFALIAGTLPVAIGMNPASKSRTAMGVAIIGGILSSTILTLIVVPAVFTYVDRFRIWANKIGGKITTNKKDSTAEQA